MALDEKTLSRNSVWLKAANMQPGDKFSHIVQSCTEIESRLNVGQKEFELIFTEKNEVGENMRWSIPLSHNAHTVVIIDYFRSRGHLDEIVAEMLVGLKLSFVVIRERKSPRDSTIINKLRIVKIDDTRENVLMLTTPAASAASAPAAAEGAHGGDVKPFDTERLGELRNWMSKNNLTLDALATIEKRMRLTLSNAGVSDDEVARFCNQPSQRERIDAMIDLLIAPPIPF
jgi:hypothetical protein